MGNSWKAAAVIGSVAVVAALAVVNGAEATNATNPAQVVVTNTGSSPVPVTGSVNVGNLPATQAVSGSVSVSNFPATQPVSGSVNVGNFPSTVSVQGSTAPAAPAHPIMLGGTLPPNLGSSTTVALFDDSTNQQSESRRMAVGSITVSTEGGGDAATVYVDLRATDCGVNGLGGIQNLTVHGDSTEHLDFPVPEIIPVVGNGSYCVVADVLNGDQVNVMSIRVVGYGIG